MHEKIKEAQEKEQDGLQEKKIIMCEVLHGTGASKNLQENIAQK